MARPLIGSFVRPGDARWGSAYHEALARFRVAALLLCAALIALLDRWVVELSLGLVLLWICAGAGAGVLRTARSARKLIVDGLEREPRERWEEPFFAVPTGPLLAGASVAGALALMGGPRGGLLGLIMLAMTFALSAGFNLGSSYGIAAWEERTAAEMLRPRGPTRWRRPRAGVLADVLGGRRLRMRQLLLGGSAGVAAAFVLFGGALASAPEVPAIYSAPGAATAVDPFLSKVAARLAGGRVDVRCFTPRGWTAVEREYGYPVAGTGSSYPRAIRLSPWVCDRLLGLRSGAFRPSARYPYLVAELASAVGVLAHEAMHVRGVDGEAETECYAVQHVFRTAVVLGADPDYARTLSHVNRAEQYPRMPPEYRSRHCRPGGMFDLRVPNGWL